MPKGDSVFSLICRLIDEYLHPCTELEAISLTRPQEQDILIALSQVLRQIKLLIGELGSGEESARERKCYGDSNLCCKEHNCLTKILAELMPLLTIESRFVQYLVGNILVAFSEFVAVSGSDWDSFVCLLCACVKLVIFNVLPSPLAPLMDGSRELSGRDQLIVAVLRPRLKNKTWSAAAGVIRVLCNVLKWLKHESDDELLQVYFGHVDSFLQDMPWEFVDDFQIDHNISSLETTAENCQFADALLAKSVGQKDAKVVFLGNFIQLLCSLVERTDATEEKLDSEDQHSALWNIIKLVPTLLHCCLGKRGASVKVSISPYFRHKLLMLMLRLSYQTHLGGSTLISWLQLLYDYFEESLWEPITQFHAGHDPCLEGSPFALSISEVDTYGSHSIHVQRQTVLLFLRCCFGLISLEGEPIMQCTCAILNSFQAFDSASDLHCCGRKKGFAELYKWLYRHLPSDMFVDHEMYWEKCIRFGSSFIRLFVNEDDALFKVLLQLLIIPSCSEKQLLEEKCCQDLKDDIVFHISNLFNPVNLFHLFLAELHYDYEVLLDYLISKDGGISCAEYLLRSLRIICNSWKLFVTFSMDGRIMNPSWKKRKIVQDISNFESKPLPTAVKVVSPSYAVDNNRDLNRRCNHHNFERQPFNKASYCLLSLKSSVKSLFEKNLFPYNPEALLKRLTKFEELCSTVKDYDLS